MKVGQICRNRGGFNLDPFRTDRTSTLQQQQLGNLDANLKKKTYF